MFAPWNFASSQTEPTGDDQPRLPFDCPNWPSLCPIVQAAVTADRTSSTHSDCLGPSKSHSTETMNAAALAWVRSIASGLTIVIVIAAVVGCAGVGDRTAAGSFSSVRPVLETNCVHCHGHERLKQMPAFADTPELSRLIGARNWIVPGHPERSRFLRVVTLADNQSGAMPPTGHAIAKHEIEALRDWIATGASIPTGTPIPLTPRGPGPR